MRTEYVAVGMGATMVAVLVGSLAWATVTVLNQQRANAGKQFPAAPYRWSADCPPRDYTAIGLAPSECAVARHRLGSVWKLGLPNKGKGAYWYRLGDDAVVLRCRPFAKVCTIELAVIAKFLPRETPAR